MINNYPTVRVIFDRRRLSSTTKPGYIEVEISFQGKRRWIATGVKVYPENWNNDKRVIGLINAIDLNMAIENVERPILEYIRRQMIEHRPFSWSEFKAFQEISRLDGSFIEFVDKVARERADIKDSTRKNHLKLVTALKEFQKIQTFNDLTPGIIAEFDDWLRKRADYAQSTIASYHKFLKIYVNECIRRELIRHNPYAGMKIDRGKQGIRKYLTFDELESLEKTELPTKSLVKVRDVFLFQCYTGLSYSDLVQFDFKNVIVRNGQHIYNDKRRKTNENFYIVLLPQALQILQKYEYKLPVISNQQYNLRLKVIGELAKIGKSLTTHMARHTYASMCLNAGIKIEVLAQMLGHTDIKTTQIYAKMFNSTVEAAFDQLEQALSKQKNK